MIELQIGLEWVVYPALAWMIFSVLYSLAAVIFWPELNPKERSQGGVFLNALIGLGLMAALWLAWTN